MIKKGLLIILLAVLLVSIISFGTFAQEKTIAVIVPPVENPFFGTMQVIAAEKAEELGYKTIKMVHDDDANNK